MAHTIHPENKCWIGLSAQGDLGPLTIYTDKRGKTVFFLRAPPLVPASPTQEVMREFFRNAASQWRKTTRANRDAWQRAANRCSLGISGYNLWVWYLRHREEKVIETIERQSGETLIRPTV